MYIASSFGSIKIKFSSAQACTGGNLGAPGRNGKASPTGVERQTHQQWREAAMTAAEAANDDSSNTHTYTPRAVGRLKLSGALGTFLRFGRQPLLNYMVER